MFWKYELNKFSVYNFKFSKPMLSPSKNIKGIGDFKLGQ